MWLPEYISFSPLSTNHRLRQLRRFEPHFMMYPAITVALLASLAVAVAAGLPDGDVENGIDVGDELSPRAAFGDPSSESDDVIPPPLPPRYPCDGGDGGTGTGACAWWNASLGRAMGIGIGAGAACVCPCPCGCGCGCGGAGAPVPAMSEVVVEVARRASLASLSALTHACISSCVSAWR